MGWVGFSGRRAAVSRALTLFALSLWSVRVNGQQEPHTPAAPITESGNWQVRLAGGWIAGVATSGGEGQVLPFPPFVETSTALPAITRHVSSWFFGAGADLLNSINSARLLSPGELYSLDGDIARGMFSYGDGPMLAGSVSRRISQNLKISLLVEMSRSSLSVRSREAAGLEKARQTFEEYWRALRIIDSASTATAEVKTGQPSLEYALSAGFERTLARPRRSELFADLSAGMVVVPTPSTWASIMGAYSFTSVNPVRQTRASFAETDSVRLEVLGRRYRPLAMIGFGIRRDVTDKMSVELRDRILFTQDRVTTKLSAHPTRQLVSDPLLIHSGVISIGGSAGDGTIPMAIVFNSNRELEDTVSSSLSGQPLVGFDVFSGSRVQVQNSLMVGLTVRF